MEVAEAKSKNESLAAITSATALYKYFHRFLHDPSRPCHSR